MFSCLLVLLSGQKTLLVRPFDDSLSPLRIDDTFKIRGGDKRAIFHVLGIRRYDTIDDILAHESIEKIAHGTHDQALHHLERLFPAADHTKGLIVLELSIGHAPTH